VRWFELHDDKLKYFKSPDQLKEINFIPLDQAVVRIAADNMGKENCFELVTKHRVYQLVAKSPNDMEDWIRILSLYTILHSENELINQAEEMICKISYEMATFEDEQFQENFNQQQQQLQLKGKPRTSTSLGS